MALLETIEAVKKSLRISTALFDTEISALIDAAKADLITGGVPVPDETEALTLQSIKFYCRANFANGDAKERELYFDRYERLKAQLKGCGIYNGTETGGDGT